MSQLDPDRRFQIALGRARAAWGAADPAQAAALADCTLAPEGVIVPYFGRSYLVTHPEGIVMEVAETRQPTAALVRAPQSAHISINIVVLHYLLTADGTLPADRWLTFRELPDGLFYAQAFAGHAEGLLAQKFGANLDGFRQAAQGLGGAVLDLADIAYRFQAFPRLPVAVLVWAGDEDFPGQVRVMFDAHAGHYLPTEDLSGIGDWLAHRLAR